MFWLKAIELNYGDTDPSGYKTATQLDISNIPANRSFGWLRENASTTNPWFDDHGNWFEIFPTPTGGNNLTQLIRIFYFLEPTEYSSVADTIAYPESLDYRVLGLYISASYLSSIQNMVASAASMQKYEDRVVQLIATLRRGTQQPLQAQAIQDTGWNL